MSAFPYTDSLIVLAGNGAIVIFCPRIDSNHRFGVVQGLVVGHHMVNPFFRVTRVQTRCNLDIATLIQLRLDTLLGVYGSRVNGTRHLLIDRHRAVHLAVEVVVLHHLTLFAHGESIALLDSHALSRNHIFCQTVVVHVRPVVAILHQEEVGIRKERTCIVVQPFHDAPAKGEHRFSGSSHRSPSGSLRSRFVVGITRNGGVGVTIRQRP